MNRFKGLDLGHRVSKELWKFITLYRRQWPKPSQRKRNARRQSGCWGQGRGALQIAEKRREAKGMGERVKHTQLNAEFQRIRRPSYLTLLNEQCKEIKKNTRMGKTRDLFNKIEDIKGTFHARMGRIKDRNGKDLTEAEEIKKRWHEYTKELYKKVLMTQITTMV